MQTVWNANPLDGKVRNDHNNKEIQTLAMFTAEKEHFMTHHTTGKKKASKKKKKAWQIKMKKEKEKLLYKKRVRISKVALNDKQCVPSIKHG